MRLSLIIDPEKYKTYRLAMPTEAGRYALSVILDSNSMSGWGNGTIEYMAALDAIEVVTSHLHAVKSLHRQKGDWLLGFITYDYKNQIEKFTTGSLFFQASIPVYQRQGQFQAGIYLRHSTNGAKPIAGTITKSRRRKNRNTIIGLSFKSRKRKTQAPNSANTTAHPKR